MTDPDEMTSEGETEPVKVFTPWRRLSAVVKPDEQKEKLHKHGARGSVSQDQQTSTPV